MTQATLAEACGLERTSVTNLEAGRQMPRLDVLHRMADVLKMAPDELLGCTPAARPCCGSWSSCAVPCVPRASHWQAEAHRMTDRVHELQGLIAQRALEELREQERRHGAGG
jgi:transcriptional regulator with XRE-family HTH domain